ncbi:dolichol-phosphate mannosyltransferase [Cnuella takakiae]|uniref:Dolichol-phosphate mannosyltransferase n=1 Tax=Cnuella takakiae TaxID=1302690 RepID=A0A1M4Y434_9BACT|nr:glycosyltransferase family 2 protein [Cnuella takakiae]OLY93044.1 glycosyltransferase [Cnuella takakiae]SHF00554.1 dolichol-phosphate mannosyltransferase [Cnuella takakiae]
MKANVSIVIPAFNEAENIHRLIGTLHAVFEDLPYAYQVLVVDDGSRDGTLDVLRRLQRQDDRVQFLSFSRNFGHQHALKAGLAHAQGDCVISMDADLQHPPHYIPKMIDEWEKGFDIVYTIREDDPNLSYFKRKSSDLFYNMLNFLSDLEFEKGTADFRLVSRQVADVLNSMDDSELFYRGLVKWVGFKQTCLYYKPLGRFRGQSKYTFRKMMRLAQEGVTSFSTRPLDIATYLGLGFSMLSVAYLPYALLSHWLGHTISGWTSIIMTIAFFGGLQLLILGIIGKYLGKLFVIAKRRPAYIIKESSLEWKKEELFY